jgi:2-polyprenyl-6-methoxyphenol hydroxylase-like FAD-dependent oxidoreductase
VLLVEAQPVFDERVCGAYLCPAGVALLDELQLRNELTAGMRLLLGMVLVAPNGKRLQTRFPSGTRAPNFGISLLRPQFDNALLQAAARAGATVRFGARMQNLHRAAEGWMVELQNGEHISARLLIGADGRKSQVARLLGLATPPWQKRVALHVDVPSLTETEPYGEMHVFEDGSYIGINPIGRRRLNISALCGPDEFHGGTARDFVNQRTQSSPQFRHRIARLAEEAKVRATFPAASNARDVVAANAALIGDASGFLDPLTGEGIYQALWTARALAENVSVAWQSDARLNEALRRYATQRRHQHLGKRLCCQAFQGIIRRAHLTNSIHRFLSLREGVGDAFIGLIGNNYTPAQAAWNIVKALA